MATILIVDDAAPVRERLAAVLRRAGHRVFAVEDAGSALAVLALGQVELVVLDDATGRRAGVAVLEELQDRPLVPPILTLSGVREWATGVPTQRGRAAGPVAPALSEAEVVARVARRLAATGATLADPDLLRIGTLEVRPGRRTVTTPEELIHLSARESAVLAHLASRRGEVCTRAELLYDVWGPDADPESPVVAVCLRRLVAKLGAYSPIEQVRDIGYYVPADLSTQRRNL